MIKIVLMTLLLVAILSGGYAVAGCNPFTEDCGPFHSNQKTSIGW